MTDFKSNRATLKTVAKMTGLSLSTVSLSLRDGSKVKPSTKKRVAEAARQVGYVPNRAGVRLRTGRTNVLALVLTADSDSIDFTRLLIQGIGQHLLGSPYHLNVVPEIKDADQMASVEYILQNRTADGIILTHTSAHDPRVRYLLDENYPFVCHGRTEFDSPHAFHDFHAERFVELAVKRIAGRGRKNVMLAAVDNQTTNYKNIIHGFSRALVTNSIDGFINQDKGMLTSSQTARNLGCNLSTIDPTCDAIICNNEMIALAMISGMRDSGRILGQDYDLICKQTTSILPTLYPLIDTISEDLLRTGRDLAKLLLERLNGGDVANLQTLQEPSPCWRSDIGDAQ